LRQASRQAARQALSPAELRVKAAQLRRIIVEMMGANKAHHFGGSLSAADIVTTLYFYAMAYDAGDPAWEARDRFILSKGHCVPAQYAALAMLGVLPMEELATLKQLGARLQGHPAAHLLPGIEACTGSLGQGLSFANGVALASRIRGVPYRVYCLMGDGETQEGQVWEAARTAPLQRLGNLTAIIDRNRLKAMDRSYCGAELADLPARWAAFGWRVLEVDGHDVSALCDALDWAQQGAGAPAMIIADTVKGKGVSFMEDQPFFHNAALTPAQVEVALAELDRALALAEEAR